MVRDGTTDASPKRHPPLVEGLLKADAYPHPVRNLHLRQTHVSWLFFTGDYVYKVKKPVDFPFLDFTTLEKRKHFCRREVSLNNRMSPRVYLGVVPITRKDGGFRVMGAGEAVDYAVRMHQLPEDTTLASLIQAGQVRSTHLEQIARRIARFHQSAPTGPEIVRQGDRAATRRKVEENFSEILGFVGPLFEQEAFDDVTAYSRAFLEVKKSLFARRAGNGRIRSGHGDLHAGNIFLTEGIQIIDCIEFNDRFRCLDVAEDIAFLAMDLDYFGRPDLSRSFIDAYIEASRDEEIEEVLAFFKTYRACIRAKVCTFRLQDSRLRDKERRRVEAEAKSYFELARSYAWQVWDRPRLVVTSGLMGTGKTTVARELAKRWKLEYVSSDILRKRLAGVPASEHKYEAYGEGIYSKEFTAKTYAAMVDAASEILADGRSVLLDASFQLRRDRARARSLSRDHSADLFIVECTASDEVLRERLSKRNLDPQQTVSDGRWALLEKQKKVWEPFRESAIRLDTEAALEETIRSLIQALYTRKLARQSKS